MWQYSTAVVQMLISQPVQAQTWWKHVPAVGLGLLPAGLGLSVGEGACCWTCTCTCGVLSVPCSVSASGGFATGVGDLLLFLDAFLVMCVMRAPFCCTPSSSAAKVSTGNKPVGGGGHHSRHISNMHVRAHMVALCSMPTLVCSLQCFVQHTTTRAYGMLLAQHSLARCMQNAVTLTGTMHYDRNMETHCLQHHPQQVLWNIRRALSLS